MGKRCHARLIVTLSEFTSRAPSSSKRDTETCEWRTFGNGPLFTLASFAGNSQKSPCFQSIDHVYLKCCLFLHEPGQIKQ